MNTNNTMRRTLICAASATFFLALATTPAKGQNAVAKVAPKAEATGPKFPDKPITLYVGFAEKALADKTISAADLREIIIGEGNPRIVATKI